MAAETTTSTHRYVAMCGTASYLARNNEFIIPVASSPPPLLVGRGVGRLIAMDHARDGHLESGGCREPKGRSWR